MLYLKRNIKSVSKVHTAPVGGQFLVMLVLDLENSQVFWTDSTETCNWTLPLNMSGFTIDLSCYLMVQ